MNKTNRMPTIDELLSRGMDFHQGGQLEQAKLTYEQILKISDRHYDALHYLAIVLAQQNHLLEAEKWLRKAISVNLNDERAFNNLGLILQGLNDSEGAVAAFNQAISLNPGVAETFYNRACLLQHLGRYQQAIDDFSRAIELKPDHVESLNNRGNCQDEIHLYDDAIISYQQALKFRPDYAECLYNLGLVLGKVGRLSEALESCQKASILQPQDPDILNSIGFIQGQLDQNNEALASYEKSLEIFDRHPETYFNYACLLEKLQQYEAALASYSRAIELKPDYAEALNHRGNVMLQLQRYDLAIDDYNKAISLKPNYSDAFFNRGNAHYRAGFYSKSIHDYKKALDIDPENAKAKWAQTISTIPPVINSAEEAITFRKNFHEALLELDAWFSGPRQEEGYRVVGSRQPFYLAYQDQNNKELLEQYGNVCTRLMSAWQVKNDFEIDRKSPNQKVRIGIVSNHIHDHSVWNAIIKGWVSEINQEQFEICIFYLGHIEDKETQFAKARANIFIQANQSLTAWVKEIHKNNIDVLIYPEIGMNAEALQLASMRLAPLQIASWGHPETTGLKTIDYYFSAELMEAENAQSHYVEKIYPLPNMGCYYFPMNVNSAPLNLEKLGLDYEKPIFLCPGTPYKYIEKYDSVYLDIARGLKDCQLVFFKGNHFGSLRLEDRLKQKFKAANICFDDYIKFIPWLSRGEFFGLMSQATVYLDTIGFSGFNTAMQALECNLPIVTMKTAYLRGNLAAAPLRFMQISDLVVNNESEYVSQAIKLAKDSFYRNYIKTQIESRKYLLFKDYSVILNMENFLLEHFSKEKIKQEI